MTAQDMAEFLVEHYGSREGFCAATGFNRAKLDRLLLGVRRYEDIYGGISLQYLLVVPSHDLLQVERWGRIAGYRERANREADLFA